MPLCLALPLTETIESPTPLDEPRWASEGRNKVLTYMRGDASDLVED